MISKKMESALNEQMGLEAYASFLYLAMAAWCDHQGLRGCTAFMRRQSDEEKEHMLRIVNYMSTVAGRAVIPAVSQPPQDYDSVRSMFEQVYAHEQKVTKSINHLVQLADEEKDYSTHHFLQWYIAEQREEEDLMRNILDRIRLIGDGSNSLYFIDKEVEAINQATAAGESEEETA
ncbi:MAG TPA: ferritin [Saprospiraceae bacterium]|nr:ferritin [Saprospiraceae bacterium]HPG06881.1 ferritin [Saprospiraceae bacterium]HQU52652.1 ferritin [Saprospiraceae bacterium]HRV84373.1 ferritin [Saprospiraceae bacterium]